MKKRYWLSKLFFISLILISFLVRGFTKASDSSQNQNIYRVKIEGTIDLGLAHYVSRAIREANERNGQAILLEINTFGGRVDAATQIRDAIYASKIPVVAYITSRAWSAGALISLACPHIVMTEGSSIGAAEPIPTTPKTISALEGELRAEAERYHRDSQIAGGMVNPNVEIPSLKKKGEILTLTAQNAVAKKIAEGILSTEKEVLKFYHWQGALSDIEFTKSELFTRFITNPNVSTILLTIGILGIQVEILTQHAIAGIFGLLALGFFFGGHLVANLTDIWFLVLFMLGIALILFELHVLPGHGVSGLLGILAILASFFFVLGGGAQAVREVAISLALATAIFILLLRFLPKAPIFKKLILQTTALAATVQVKEISRDLDALIGKTGTAISELRPSGIVAIDNKRYSALSEGEFLPPGTNVRVISYQGSSLVVERGG